MTIGSGALEATEAIVALLLLAASLWAMPRALWRAGRVALAPPPATARLTALALGLGALARLLAPPLLATIFIGYKQTEQAATLLPISHYGVGSQALYHTLFAFFPVDHRVIIAANTLLGTLTLPLAAALAARLHRDGRAGTVAAWLLALTPLFIRNDTSEANNVPALFWLLGGLVLLDEHLERARALPLVLATPLLALAAIARPEMPLLVVAGAACVLLAAPARPRLRPLALAIAAGATLIVPHLIHVADAISALREADSLPGIERSELLRLPARLYGLATPLRPELFPFGVTASAALALILRGRAPRRVDLALAATALLALAITIVDLDQANMARVHVPASLFLTLLAAGGLVRIASMLRRPRLRGLPLALVLVTAIPSASTLWAPTNEATEERLIEAAEAAIPPGEFMLLRPGAEDRRQRPESRFTHYHFPDYLFLPPARNGMVRPLGSFLSAPDFFVPTWFFRGMRCYADFRPRGEPPPPGSDELPACRAMAERFRLEPVVEWTVPNAGDVWISYYGDAPSLTVGLYRVHPRD
ncbi:MAG: glycosyltransferase family 39 protein [Deltaproteobacteria bacterium]|nr:glycosyltransferase family 39 protein [Deltaproteobacteria bacterium]MCB9785304.1 glycosyltransferase family 39 protein [Deltaproteobacteria bacterium]